MTSRLDRLVTLLESGSTQLIRNTAAQQLADIQKQHPDELFNLLGRVLQYLQSKSYDTRTAAAKAIGGIVDNAETFDPNLDDEEIKTERDWIEDEDVEIKKEGPETENDDLLQLETLDMASILQHGKKLLGSAGREYEYSLARMDAAERLAHQKKSLTSRLGLGGEYIEDDLVNEEDFAQTPGLPRVDTSIKSRQPSMSSSSPWSASPANQTTNDESGLSKRQLNQLKRKNKSIAKSGSNKMRVVDLSTRKSSIDHGSLTTSPFPIRANGEKETNGDHGLDDFTLKRELTDDDSKIVSEFKGHIVPEKPAIQTDAEQEGLEWPFERMCEFLTVDLFDPNWEVRHGTSMGLTQVLRRHGAGAGRRLGKTRSTNNLLNRKWLDDLACRLLCVLMLDRFGDYVSDTVVAPVREAIGQTLGALLLHLPEKTAVSVYRLLHRMIMQTDPSLVVHSGMIGLKYFAAVRTDLLLRNADLIDGVLEAVTRGLAHGDDDVRSMSAATLIPISKELIKLRPTALRNIVNVVWDCLAEIQDDLSASTGAVMDLLAKLCTFPETLEAMGANADMNEEYAFDKLVPRLFGFLRHTISSVRAAVLRALLTFISLKDEDTNGWVNARICRLVFQNLLVERNEGVLHQSLRVWQELLKKVNQKGFDKHADDFATHLPSLIAMTLHPVGTARAPIPMNPGLFIRASGAAFAPMQPPPPRTSTNGEPPTKRRRKTEKKDEASNLTHNVDGHMLQGDIDLVTEAVVIRSRIFAARALGLLLSFWNAQNLPDYWQQIVSSLHAPQSSTQLAAAMIIEEFAKSSDNSSAAAPRLSPALHSMVENDRPTWYTDIALSLQAARGQCHAMLNAFRDHAHVPAGKVPSMAVVCQGDPDAGPNAFSLADAEKIAGPEYERLLKALTPAQRVTGVQFLSDARASARSTIEEARRMKEQRDSRIRAAAAAALVALKDIPKKPSMVIKGMMDSVKTEENVELQQRSAASITSLIEHYTSSAKRGPVDKVISNIVKFYCIDTSETPEFHTNAHLEKSILSLRKEEDRKDHADAAKFEQEAKEARIMRRGAKATLEQLTSRYGPSLLEQIPNLRALIETPLQRALGEELPKEIMDPESNLGQEVVDGLSTLRALAPSIHSDLYPWITRLMPTVVLALRSKLSVIRYAAAKCFSTLCSVINAEGITMLVEKVMPSISSALDVHYRQGIVECIYHLIHVMEDNILPYVIFLIVPILGRMSDSDNDVRLLATTSFATLVKLVPLEAGIPDPPGLSAELLQGRERERKFMAQMLDPKKVDNFEIPVAIKAELRPYQQDGVNWLSFLNRYGLHGVLCDDMGLGKTLQTICAVSSSHYFRAEEYAQSKSADSRPLPSLIVCPPTLSGHWQQEIAQFAPFLHPVAYVGPPLQRSALRKSLATADIVITSYDIVRNDLAVFTPLSFNYMVLDEGHLIKNPKAKTTVAVKQLISNHRLILSGTPIQNNVLELWSLFDFLMPGFLGTEKVFIDRFAKPIAASRNAKSSSKEQEAGALAIEALHKQVLPFLLRRLKEEVLNDLPPKIIQNYYCDLSDLQRRLYEDFFKSQKKVVQNSLGSDDKDAKKHIFTALQYMRKLCNSPALVLKENSPQYASIAKSLAASNSSIRDVAHAPKLGALKDLLVDCGIGVADTLPKGKDSSSSSSQDLLHEMPSVSQHRALIFCQQRETLDLITSSVLSALLPSVTYLRLDGSVEATRRQNIVNTFNTDPSYDCLLLTTSVGGLGLNLTGADTVIFVEHDWNPQKDIQAMDRAHRIGQRKVVNVYRLIARGSVEEKIMNLQRFKIDVASTVVNQQNAGLNSMATGEILDLFNLGEGAEGAEKAPGATKGDAEDDMGVDEEGNVKERGKKGWLEGVQELWDERQYEEEFNLEGFLQQVGR